MSNQFSGRYMIICIEVYSKDKGWIPFKKYERSELVWLFTQQRTIKFASGEIVYEGKLAEKPSITTNLKIEYSYHSQNQQLHINRYSDSSEDSDEDLAIRDKYRVRHLSKNDYWLYDLIGVKAEPEDYWIRIKIRRATR